MVSVLVATLIIVSKVTLKIGRATRISLTINALCIFRVVKNHNSDFG